MAAKKTDTPEVRPEVTIETVPTPAGDARITWHHAPGAHALLAASHGAGGGIEARDLRALAAALP
ncbi:hydrolase, partial [Streptomyces sp. 4503]|nr:hydrolase [Streptomyces niphimycinicus]